MCGCHVRRCLLPLWHQGGPRAWDEGEWPDERGGIVRARIWATRVIGSSSMADVLVAAVVWLHHCGTSVSGCQGTLWLESKASSWIWVSYKHNHLFSPIFSLYRWGNRYPEWERIYRRWYCLLVAEKKLESRSYEELVLRFPDLWFRPCSSPSIHPSIHPSIISVLGIYWRSPLYLVLCCAGQFSQKNAVTSFS